MRDRLIELICHKQDYGVVYERSQMDDRKVNIAEIANSTLADYLLENGVIVPPCKVGDKVYLIPTYNGKPYCGVIEDKIQMIGITSRGIHIKARNHHDHNKMYMLGKGAFLTKEEAEQVLKGGRGDG